MGLEVTTYINGLNTAWPLAGDTKSQGDDHIRLLKGVLTATFPNATRPFYIPSVEAFASTIVLDATDQNNLIIVDTTTGDISCTLPGTLGTNDKGWECEIIRTNTGGGNNGIVVSPTTGTIASTVGSTATIRIERVYEPVRFKWTGTGWFCVKPGIPIGASINWDGATIPQGFRASDGTTLSSTTFAELNAVWGGTTLRDKRGRVEAGLDNGSVNRLTASYFGTASILGAVGGSENHSLTVAQHATLTSSGTITVYPGGDNTKIVPAGDGTIILTSAQPGSGTRYLNQSGGSALSNYTAFTGSNSLTTSGTGGTTGVPHNNVQPTLITNKLIRVC